MHSLRELRIDSSWRPGRVWRPPRPAQWTFGMLASARRPSSTIPARSRLLGWGGLLLLVGVGTGTALFHLAYGLSQLSALRTVYLQCLAIGTTYTVVMTVCLKGTAHWMRGRVPLRTRWDVGVHVAIQSVSTILSFGAATGLVWLVLGDALPLATDLIVQVAVVSFFTVLIWNSFAYMRAFYQRLRKSEAAVHEARLQALRAQVSPHFLFNALNSIAALVYTHPREAQDVVVNLAELFRYTLEASQSDHVTLADELRAARQYLSIEQARFGERLTVEFDVPESLLQERLPGMIVQPLVENAVKHGMGATTAPCTIRVEAHPQNDHVVLRVTDTGPGFDTTNLDVLTERGTGLANIRERLRFFFDDEADLRVLLQGVELRLPLRFSITALS